MKRLICSGGLGDPNGPTMGLALLLVAMCSHLGNWMPVTINGMVACLGLALIARAFDSTALIKARRFLVTGTAAIAVILYATTAHDRCQEFTQCTCTQASVSALTDRVLRT